MPVRLATGGAEELGLSLNHCYETLTGCPGTPPAVPFATAADEIDNNTTYLQQNIGVPTVWTMAYPFGDTSYEPLAKTRFFLARGIPTGGTPVYCPTRTTGTRASA